MLKKIIIILFSIFLLVGCKEQNKVESDKIEYLEIKSDLEEVDEFTEINDLPCDITISLNREDEESIKYNVLINNPKIDMYNIKALVIHNQFTEEVYPSIGLMNDETSSLLLNNMDDDNKIFIDGNLETTNDIKKLSLEFRVWLEYDTSDGEKKTIYYKTTI